jgi:phosphoribosylglycinamide formyltransferase 1
VSAAGRVSSSANRIGVLISGRGSNLMAILDRIDSGDLDAVVAVVLCNEPAAAGVAAARARGVEVVIVDHRVSPTRDEHDRRMAAELESRAVALVCLAGYMRLLSPWFVRRFAGRILNIHPSLLPAFPGLATHRQALAAGVRVHGATVHFVSSEVDGGAIIAQAAIAVLPDDNEEDLAARILQREHVLLPRCVRWLCEGRVVLSDGRAALRNLPGDALALFG